jgi:hypothetical protein
MSKTKSDAAGANTGAEPSPLPAEPSLPADVADELARLRAERDAAVQFAERADAAARAAHDELAAVTARGEAPARTAHGDRPVKIRALSGLAFTLGGERRRLRTGETLEAAPSDLEDDGLALGTHFEILR